MSMATRKSTRLTEKPKATQLAQTEPGGSSEDERTPEKAEGSRRVKKQKTSNKKGVSNAVAVKSNRKGTRRAKWDSIFMKEVPVDVILEIFRLLEPIDLLYLSRVSKNLHDLLASNDVVFVWKLAYGNILFYGPPPCPDDMNIVFYTNYLYGRHCQLCGSVYGRVYHEAAFIRLCSKCAKSNLLTRYEFDDDVRHLCYEWPFYLTKRRRQSEKKFFKTEINLRLKEFKEAKQEKAVRTYVDKRKLSIAEHRHVGRDIASWRERRQATEAQNLELIHKGRKAYMRKKLEEEGRLDNHVFDTHRIPHHHKSHELTESEWNNIRADVLDFFQDFRDDICFHQLRHKLEERVKTLNNFISQWRIRPTAWWIISSSEFIMSFIKDEELDETEDFEKIKSQLFNIITSWREETDFYLASLIPLPSGKGKKKDTGGNTNVLELATTFFECRWCTEPIGYPRVLVHSCFAKVKDRDDHDDSDDPATKVVANRGRRREPRPPKIITPDDVLPRLSYSMGMHAGMEGVTFSMLAYEVARDIITVCGEDPDIMTYAEMGEKGARLECLRCSRLMQAKPEAIYTRRVMKWNMALVHELMVHRDESPSSEPVWRKIEELDDLEKIHAMESYQMERSFFMVSCHHCPEVIYSRIDDQLRHIRKCHKIAVKGVTLSDHFSPMPDTSISKLDPAVEI